MKINEAISISVKDNVVVLVAKGDYALMYFGSSCPASVHPGVEANTVSFDVSPDSKGEVVAVRISSWQFNSRQGEMSSSGFLLWIMKESEKTEPWVELKETFVPKPGRLGQVLPEYGVSVRIGDEFFLSPVYMSDEEIATLKHEYRMVSVDDATLLCRFLAGKADASEVTAKAEALMRTLSLLEEELRKTSEEELTRMSDSRDFWKKRCEEYISKFKDICGVMSPMSPARFGFSPVDWFRNSRTLALIRKIMDR